MTIFKTEADALTARTHGAYSREASVWPIRIPVAEFHENNAQKQVRCRNKGVLSRDFNKFSDCPHAAAHNALCRSWGVARHGHDARDYIDITDTYRFMEIYDPPQDRPLGGLLFAVHEHGDTLEARYFFYDVGQKRRSLGIMTLLSFIDLARETGYAFCDLGQWAPAPSKTAYKTGFRPYELMQDRRWVRYP
jgi:arginine-tRNA-protein transferase